VYNSFRARLPDREGSDAATCTVVLNPASLSGGLQAVTRPAVPCASRASSMKKSLAGLSVQQGTPVSNARAHVSKAPDVRAIMGLQDVRVDTADNACKMCG
jgi:hypothetical protein